MCVVLCTRIVARLDVYWFSLIYIHTYTLCVSLDALHYPLVIPLEILSQFHFLYCPSDLSRLVMKQKSFYLSSNTNGHLRSNCMCVMLRVPRCSEFIYTFTWINLPKGPHLELNLYDLLVKYSELFLIWNIILFSCYADIRVQTYFAVFFVETSCFL